MFHHHMPHKSYMKCDHSSSRILSMITLVLALTTMKSKKGWRSFKKSIQLYLWAIYGRKNLEDKANDKQYKVNKIELTISI